MENQSNKYWISTHEAIPIQTRMILNEYLLGLKLANKAEATISKYRSILERFCSECLVPLSSLTSEDVLKWVNKYSVGKKYSTVIIVLSILTTFFNFCFEEGYMDKMLMKRRWVPKVSQPLPRYFTEETYSHEKITKELVSYGYQGTALFYYPYPSHWRCRLSEVANLLIQDVDVKQ